ncbi:glycoside hydrolase domain-containing protein [Agreia sp. COWG]|uniref:glycoside hydrolase domain-containing protein n=1 Tax=Agreia sp. COWG TaxID=2773266 RepID=UPI0019270529|nr:glycoside hydrolase domain-containing protein [Agreia sp. COWG]
MDITRRTALIGLVAAAPLVVTMAEPQRAAAATTQSEAPTGVLAVQRWLNSTFGAQAGWVHVDEDGVAGQGTLAGLVQALQVLLAISPVVPAFGPTTAQKLQQHGPVGAETGADAKQWCLVVQGALICRGFTSVALSGAWDDATTKAVGGLRDALGSVTSGATLTTNLVRALLTVEAIAPVGDGRSEIVAIQRWLNGAYGETAGATYCSASGAYDSSTRTSLVRAVQLGAGVDPANADGIYGPATAKALRATSASVVGVGAQGAWVRLVKALLLLNGDRVSFDDTFTQADAGALTAFQQFQALAAEDQTGVCRFPTWAALLVSYGDADRAVTGADLAHRLDAGGAQAVAAAGYTIIGRYLTNSTATGALDKMLTTDEVASIAAAKLRVWPIFEEGGDELSWFSRAQGVTDAHRAVAAAEDLGVPKQTTIYFAVDLDVTAEQVSSSVTSYFEGIAQGLQDAGDVYKAGVYGSRLVCSRISHAGLAHFSFVAGMSSGWGGNETEPMPENWAFNQIQARPVGAAGTIIDIDANVVSGRDDGVGPQDWNSPR